MPVFKDVFQMKFGVSVLLVLLTCLAVGAVGAGLIAWGITPIESLRVWGCAAWGLGSFVGARHFAKGKDGVLLRAVLVAAAAYGVICLAGLAFKGNVELASNWVVFGGSALAGSVLAAMIRPKKRKRGKVGGKGRDPRGKRR